MPQSLSAVYLHAIFSTKDRTPYLQNASFRKQVFDCLSSISNDNECPSVLVGGWNDHIHILSQSSPSITQHAWIKEMKRVSTIWIRSQGSKNFSWQTGFCCLSVSPSNLDKVVKYIANQEEHHGKVTFQDEYRKFLYRHGLEFDEKYVWI
jgi:putative transposase